MFKFRPNVVLRFNLLVIFAFTLAGIIIVGKAAIIMFIERDEWNKNSNIAFSQNSSKKAREKASFSERT